MRRSIIAASAALALGGSLAIAASASAAQIPWGTAGVANSTSVNGLLTTADTGLIQAQNLVVLTNGILVASSDPPIDAGFPTAYTSASSLTAATVAEIATDISTAANTDPLELGVCVSAYLTANDLPPTNTNIGTAANYCETTPAALSAAATSSPGRFSPV